MPEKIAGIIMLGLARIAGLAFLFFLITRRDKQQEADRRQRMAVKDQNDKFVIDLFHALNNDKDEQIEKLREERDHYKSRSYKLEKLLKEKKIVNIQEEHA